MRRFQQGNATWVLLLILIAVGGHAMFDLGQHGNAHIRREIRLTESLRQAKEALIAYAVTDSNRPGRLPCPDVVGNGVSPILSRDDCDSYSGWLPWKTLDLREAEDDRGIVFYYSLSRWFGGDRKTPPLNSDTPGTLSITTPEGVESQDIAAIIIASRGSLDPANADGDLRYRPGSAQKQGDDDVMAIITRAELMAAVEKRIAAEARSCLEQYAVANGHYPWPAPISATTYQGSPGSHFGRIPETQPQGNAESVMAETANLIQATRQKISEAVTSEEQIEALKNASDLLSEITQKLLRPWAYAAQSLADKANLGIASLGSQTKAIDMAVANDRISRTEKTNLRVSALANKDSIEQLVQQISDIGLDPFPAHLAKQTRLIGAEADKLNLAQTVSSAYVPMLSMIDALNELLRISHTGNGEITQLLDNAFQSSAMASARYAQAQQQPDNSVFRAAAVGSARTLIAAVDALRTGILTQRAGIHPSEFSALSEQLSLRMVSAAAPDRQLVEQTLLRMKLLTASINTQSHLLLVQRDKTLSSLENATAQIKSGNSPELLSQNISAVIADINNLAEQIQKNGDNIPLESIRLAASNYAAAEKVFATIEPRTQQDMVPYVDALKPPAEEVKNWLNLFYAMAGEIGAWDDLATGIISGIDRKGEKLPDGSLTTALTFASRPTEANRVAAQTSKNQTILMLDDLKEKLATFNASQGSAMPIAWSNASCSMLSPDNTEAWWAKNLWKQSVFYQISGRHHDQTGQLKINGLGQYKLVVISAGQTAWREVVPCQWQVQRTQDRTSNTRQISDFLEAENADPSRNGVAKNPRPEFVSKRSSYFGRLQFDEYSRTRTQCATGSVPPDNGAFPILTFNDQVAY